MSIVNLKLVKNFESDIGIPRIEILQFLTNDNNCFCRFRDDTGDSLGLGTVSWRDLSLEIAKHVYVEDFPEKEKRAVDALLEESETESLPEKIEPLV